MVNCRGYTQETALSRRVKDWEDKIRPELLLQVEHTGNQFGGGWGEQSCRDVSVTFVFRKSVRCLTYMITETGSWER